MNEPGGDPAPILAEADLRAAVERLPFPLAAGGGATLRPMTTDDVDAAYRAAVDANLEIAYEITNEEWGVRRFFFRDAGGNVVNVLAHM